MPEGPPSLPTTFFSRSEVPKRKEEEAEEEKASAETVWKVS